MNEDTNRDGLRSKGTHFCFCPEEPKLNENPFSDCHKFTFSLSFINRSYWQRRVHLLHELVQSSVPKIYNELLVFMVLFI